MTVPTLVDSHCHLDMEQFDADRAAVLERAQAHGVRMIVNPGIDLVHCRQAISLADLHPQVYAAVGIHPNSIADFSEQTLTQLRGLAEHPKVVAIGEIGLDYHWGTVSRPKQAQAFRAPIEGGYDSHGEVFFRDPTGFSQEHDGCRRGAVDCSRRGAGAGRCGAAFGSHHAGRDRPRPAKSQ